MVNPGFRTSCCPTNAGPVDLEPMPVADEEGAYGFDVEGRDSVWGNTVAVGGNEFG